MEEGVGDRFGRHFVNNRTKTKAGRRARYADIPSFCLLSDSDKMLVCRLLKR